MKIVGVISATSLLAIIGAGLAMLKWWPGYRGPKPLYIEVSFWPIYALALATWSAQVPMLTTFCPFTSNVQKGGIIRWRSHLLAETDTPATSRAYRTSV